MDAELEASAQVGCFRADFDAGDRQRSVGGRLSQWLADINGDGRADYIYNPKHSHEYRVQLARQDLPYSNGVFMREAKAGERNKQNDIGLAGGAEWMADVNGDGRADYVYNRNNRHEYWVMLGQADGTFATDAYAGSRFTDNGVANSGWSQWMADINGDGRADYVYNRAATKEYWVMLGEVDGTFHRDTKAGARLNAVDSGGRSQWFVDVTADGRADLVYGRAGSREYWVMVAKADGTFEEDVKWGARAYDVANGHAGAGLAQMDRDGRADLIYQRNGTKQFWVKRSRGNGFHDDVLWGAISHDQGWGARTSFLSDVTGDGLPDLVYNRAGTKERWVAVSCNPLQESDPLEGQIGGPIRHLDVWGQGYVVDGSMVTGFEDATNLDMKDKVVWTGPNKDKPIPNLIPVDCTGLACAPPDKPVFPIAKDAVEIMTSMGGPIYETTARQMYRTIKDTGVVILYGHDEDELDEFIEVFVEGGGWHEVAVTLNYPFDRPTLRPVRAYSRKASPISVGYGKGARVGGVGRSETQQNSPSGGRLNHDEL